MRWDAPATVELAREHGLSEEEYRAHPRRTSAAPRTSPSSGSSPRCGRSTARTSRRGSTCGSFPTERAPRRAGPRRERRRASTSATAGSTVFKMESHNHPSFIEPYQGAATGVGGILRDVFTMGARPIMLLDSLRFGALDAPRMTHLVDGVVRGIGDYGNCVGVPTVGGEVDFHPSYNGNVLVNAMCVGVARGRRGSSTGAPRGPATASSTSGRRPGATASTAPRWPPTSSTRRRAEKRPTVQVGDPFTEKLLIECCLELMARGLVVGIQDMGAGGPHLVGVRDGGARRVRAHPRPLPGAGARDRA